MSSKGASKDYSFTQKEHWRNWAWNQLAELAPSEGVVLYLAGPQDLDRATAIRKGFRDIDLIGVDTDIRNVRRVRRAGGHAICADLLDVLWDWPRHTKVAAVMADFCAGLDYGTISVFDAFQNRAVRGAAAVFNFQRGRDAFSNGVRQWMSAMGLDQPMSWAELPEGLSRRSLRRLSKKKMRMRVAVRNHRHRGYQFLLRHLACYAQMSTSYRSTTIDNPDALWMIPPGPDRDIFKNSLGIMMGATRARFSSYRSGKSLRMDSVACIPMGIMNNAPRMLLKEIDKDVERIRAGHESAGEARPYITATLATRTRRMATC